MSGEERESENHNQIAIQEAQDKLMEPQSDAVDDDDDDGPPPGWDAVPPPRPLSDTPPSATTSPPQTPPPSEKGQMVCGSCRRLLSYERGSKYVQCSCCQTANYVLEEHQVGQVKCSNCGVLLMYPYGAQSVRCSSCHSITDIGEHNKRPPLSVQQSQATRPFNVAV